MIQLGVIGLGQRMAEMVENFARVDPEVRVTALLDADPEAALLRLPDDQREGVRCVSSVDEMMQGRGVDALAIGTRCDSHARYATEAAHYDVPVFLEKPVATRLEDAKRLERAFAGTRSRVLVSFPLRTSQLGRQVKRLIERGNVGRVEHLLAFNYVNYGDVYFSTAYKDYQVTQGLFLQKATHDFDYLAWLAGARITRVAAMAARGRVFRENPGPEVERDPLAIYRDGIGSPETGMNEDSSSALLEFENGAQGVYTQVFFVQRETARRGAIVTGASGTVSFDWFKNEAISVCHREPLRECVSIEADDEHFGGDAVLAQNFIDMIRRRETPVSPIEAGLDSVYVCLAAKDAVETGSFVDVVRREEDAEPSCWPFSQNRR